VTYPPNRDGSSFTSPPIQGGQSATYPPPFPRAPRVRSRPLLHLTLLGFTVITLAITGGGWWELMLPQPIDWITPSALFRAAIAGIPYAFWVLLILGAHEMGHYLACRHYGIPATLPFFVPGIPPLGSFGAVIRIRGIIPNRKALFDVAAAGPIAGFAIAFPLLLVQFLSAEAVVPMDEPGLRLGSPLALYFLRSAVPEGMTLRVDSVFVAGWVGMLVTSLNLFPVGQLDGGHAAYAVSRRLHRWLSRVTVLGLFLFVALQWFGLGQAPAYTLWLVILLWMRDRHPRLLDESTPLGPGRKLVAILLAAIFLLSFIPIPLSFVGG
jgi:membrane-associated protease RseP (regulator of RpoE activity)